MSPRRTSFVVCALVLWVGACDTPPLKIVYRVANGTGQDCGTADCAEVGMACASVLHLRILSPSDPNAPYISICEEVTPNGTHDLCAIGRIDIEQDELPREVLEVQVTVWPKDAVVDPDTGLLDCRRIPVEFDATMGFPVNTAPAADGEYLGPAFGGRAFYYPGDTETVVTLGCTDVDSINDETCSGTSDIEVTATVLDFEILPFSVGEGQADELNVFVGEPVGKVVGSETVYELNPNKSRALSRRTSMPPAWGAAVDLQFMDSACIQVLEDGPQNTASLRCKAVTAADKQIDLSGVWVQKATLQQILGALSLINFPDAGLTIGIVLDQNGNPAANLTVTSTQGSVEFLSADRSTLVAGTKTTASGMFVSRDAPYGTIFGAALTTRIGGLVEGKLTVVLFEQEGIGN